MNKLKIAIGIDGKGVFLERFPDDEEHAGLQDMFDWLADDLYEFEESPGIYLATISMESPGPAYNDPCPDPYLVVDKLEKVDGPEVLSNVGFDAGYALGLEQAKVLVEALEFYATDGVWIGCYSNDYGSNPMMLNESDHEYQVIGEDGELIGGKKARQALKLFKEGVEHE